MEYSVAVTERAARDMEETASWWAQQRSTEQAQRWYQGIRAAIATLNRSPERCALAEDFIHFPYEVRNLLYGLGSKPTHRVLFTIVRETVVVLAVRHTSRASLQPEDLA